MRLNQIAYFPRLLSQVSSPSCVWGKTINVANIVIVKPKIVYCNSKNKGKYEKSPVVQKL